MKFLNLIALCLISLSIWSANPSFKNTIAKENYVRQTNIGSLYIDTYEADFGNALIVFGANQLPYEIQSSHLGKEIKMNIELNSAPIEFHSWVLFQAFVASSLEKRIGGDLSFLAEWDLIVLSESMKYLSQAIFKVTPSIDYSAHPRFEFAKNHKLFIVDFYRTWRVSKPGFYALVEKRKRELSGSWLTVDEFIQRSPNHSQKRMALNLKKIWQELN